MCVQHSRKESVRQEQEAGISVPLALPELRIIEQRLHEEGRSLAETCKLWREMGLADREQAAREWAQRLGCAG